MKHKIYGKVEVLNRIATNRGGLIQIRLILPKNATFKKSSDNVFWVRAGD